MKTISFSYRMIFILLTASSLVILSGCKLLVGTETGNPVHQETGQESPPDQESPAIPEFCAPNAENCHPAFTDRPYKKSVLLIAAMCSRIKICRQDVVFTDCMAEVISSSYAQDIFDLPTQPRNFEDLYSWEKDQVILPRTDLISSCQVGISEITCDDSRMNMAFQPEQTHPFQGAGVFLAFTDSCKDSFEVAPEAY